MKIVCLANSFRMGGRCLGGIELDINNNPVFINGRPKWIRPVCNTENEEVPTSFVSHINLLDIIDFSSIKVNPHGHQSENVQFDINSIQLNGRYDLGILEHLSDNNRYPKLFGNKGSAVPQDNLSRFNHSLELISISTFEINERIFEDRLHPQIKLSFSYNDIVYNLPITDPVFLHKYGLNNNLLQGVNKIYITVSLTAPTQDWSYKLVAGIIYDRNLDSNTGNQFTQIIDDDLPF